MLILLIIIYARDREARMLHWTMLSLIFLSVLLLFTESLSTWCAFGESTDYCQSVVKCEFGLLLLCGHG
jgi:hypothetical protein